MALTKKIELENGVIVNYHRIVSINKITNKSIVIEVASYTSQEKRQEEIEKEGQSMNIFIDTIYLDKEYNETDSIRDLYNYLKTTEKFSEAEDV